MTIVVGARCLRYALPAGVIVRPLASALVGRIRCLDEKQLLSRHSNVGDGNLTRKMLVSDERAEDAVVCRLLTLPFFSTDEDGKVDGGDVDICSSCNDVEELCLCMECKRLILTN